MKKLFLLGLLMVGMSVMTGCGSSDEEEQLQSVEEHAVEIQKNVQESVEEQNKNTEQLGRDASELDKQ